MNEKIQKNILDKMIKTGLVESWYETVSETSDDVTVDIKSDNEDDYAYSSDGIRYNKKAAFAYLTEKGYQMNQSNIDAVAKIISEQTDTLVIHGNTAPKKVCHHILEESDDNEIMEYINFKIMDEVNKFRKEIISQSVVEYAVETVRDTSSGGTDIRRLSKVLSEYSSKGWKLKSTFTNELGVRGNSVSIGVATSGTNSTIEEIVLIFERPKYISGDLRELISRKANIR